jgi:hypothetical protein
VATGHSNRIKIETTCNEADFRPPNLIINYSNEDHWASCVDTTFSQYIQVRIVGIALDITRYSYENLGKEFYSINWDFLGSSDGKKWDVIDTHKDDYILGENPITVLPVKRGKYSFFRIKQTGINYYINTDTSYPARNILYVRNLDLFGTIWPGICSHHIKTTYLQWYISITSLFL